MQGVLVLWVHNAPFSTPGRDKGPPVPQLPAHRAASQPFVPGLEACLFSPFSFHQDWQPLCKQMSQELSSPPGTGQMGRCSPNCLVVRTLGEICYKGDLVCIHGEEQVWSHSGEKDFSHLEC